MQAVKWPHGCKSAAMFTFDLDGDIIWQNMSSDEPNADKLIRARSVGQYGPNRCVDMILDLLDKYGVKATFFVPGYVAEHNPAVVKKIHAAGHEIGNHGYTHERFVEKTREEQIEIIEKTQKIIKDITGTAPVGFRTPSGDWAVDTPYLLEERGFSYSSSMRGDDRPYRTVLDGRVTDFIEIPSKWELDDYVAQAYNIYPAEPAGLDRISCYRNVQQNYLAEFAGYHRYGLCISFLMHPQISGAPGRNQILEEILREVTSHQDVWVATGSQIADWWRQTYPAESSREG
ncbi:Bifunctional xylanase/deacetylase precursor [Anaerotruncus sp. 2789STDY5834896]|uniref:Bifunctional xylanase/deacetylase n=1 Tax=uncultured Anaerotruncus sp. TaxID=905011 RepID=A0A1C6ITC8_9FIRM|nr:Bifunctional xylanase/deacetylase precursor [uncultured Anaerotruncus sp.]